MSHVPPSLSPFFPLVPTVLFLPSPSSKICNKAKKQSPTDTASHSCHHALLYTHTHTHTHTHKHMCHVSVIHMYCIYQWPVCVCVCVCAYLWLAVYHLLPLPVWELYITRRGWKSAISCVSVRSLPRADWCCRPYGKRTKCPIPQFKAEERLQREDAGYREREPERERERAIHIL